MKERCWKVPCSLNILPNQRRQTFLFFSELTYSMILVSGRRQEFLLDQLKGVVTAEPQVM